MKELLEKLSSYNLMNYLMPGVSFIFIMEKVTTFSLNIENPIIYLILSYFIGLVISRIGSLIIESFLEKIGFIKKSKYMDFIKVENNLKLEILSETNNMYRSLTAMSMLLILIKIYNLLYDKYDWLINATPYIALIFLFALFIFSYRRQTTYIKKRVEILGAKNDNN